jgi:uncharacterized ion transporter superfamily protein YfcC
MTEPVQEQSSVRIAKKTFITALIILVALIIAVGILTQVIPTGSYDRLSQDGRETIVPDSFRFTQAARFPAWHWLTAPVEVLWSADGPTIIVIVFFILAVSAAFSLLEKSDVMTFAISKVVKKFGHIKYLLMAVVIFFFMLTGAILGTFEENIALVPIVIALAYCLGWDSLVGLGMSMLASCFGFTAAIMNPFSIAITQKIAELPLYSGFGYRLVIFAVYFAVLFLFLYRYARKIEKDPEKSLVRQDDAHMREKYRSIGGMEEMLGGKTPEEYRNVRRATAAFGISVLLIVAAVLLLSFLALSDLTLPLIGVLFIAGGFVAAMIAGVGLKKRMKIILSSIAGIAPGIILILLAMSVKFIISNGGIMDTILYYASKTVLAASPYISILLIYVLILLLELFVGSSSAKAFLVMPIIAPLSDLIGITRQNAVLAFCFGDGFSNMIYPTNPVLLICLGLTVITFPKWFKWTFKLQLISLAIACVFLLVGVAINYGPF